MPNYGPPGTESEFVRSRNRGSRNGMAHSPRQLSDRQLSVEYGGPSNQRKIHKPQNTRKRNNLASQIRSLEKLLKHPGTKMSANVRQEKGRELAALVLERERKKAKLRERKNIGKYHMVRFVERQKCDRALKQLQKRLKQVQDSQKRKVQQENTQASHQDPDTDSDMDMDRGAALPSATEVYLEEQIRQAGVDLNYTIYAPLGEKYISLFPATGKEKTSGMTGVTKSFLSPEDAAEVRRPKDDNIVQRTSAERPPMWYRVQECMRQGTLEQLRDGKLTAAPVIPPLVVGKEEALEGTTDAPDWLKDEEAFKLEDLDSTSDDDSEDSDDDQKIDGGFFERAREREFTAMIPKA